MLPVSTTEALGGAEPAHKCGTRSVQSSFPVLHRPEDLVSRLVSYPTLSMLGAL